MNEDALAALMRRLLGGKNSMGWHSLSCACDDCLAADLGHWIYGDSPSYAHRFDMKGLER